MHPRPRPRMLCRARDLPRANRRLVRRILRAEHPRAPPRRVGARYQADAVGHAVDRRAGTVARVHVDREEQQQSEGGGGEEGEARWAGRLELAHAHAQADEARAGWREGWGIYAHFFVG